MAYAQGSGRHFMKMEFQAEQVLKWIGGVFAGVLAWALAGAISAFLSNVSADFKELKNSVVELNKNMAVVVTTQVDHSQRIRRLEEMRAKH